MLGRVAEKAIRAASNYGVSEILLGLAKEEQPVAIYINISERKEFSPGKREKFELFISIIKLLNK